jgi:hypothetical protein
LDISQQADQTPSVTMGYRRAEIVSIPVAPKVVEMAETNKRGEGKSKRKKKKEPATANGTADANGTNDAYSVIGRFHAKYDPGIGKENGLHLHQFFATGQAARKAANDPNMQEAFGRAAWEVSSQRTNDSNTSTEKKK